MTGARLRSTRSAWPCPGQGLAHSPQKRAAPVTVARVDDRPLIQSPSGEHSEQAERARQKGSSPVRAETSVSGSVATRARPGGIAIELTLKEAQQLQKSLERQLKAICSSLAFWKHETALCGTEPPFNMAAKHYEAELIKRLYLGLYDTTKTMQQNETAYKAAKYQE